MRPRTVTFASSIPRSRSGIIFASSQCPPCPSDLEDLVRYQHPSGARGSRVSTRKSGYILFSGTRRGTHVGEWCYRLVVRRQLFFVSPTSRCVQSAAVPPPFPPIAWRRRRPRWQTHPPPRGYYLAPALRSKFGFERSIGSGSWAVNAKGRCAAYLMRCASDLFCPICPTF